MNAPTSHDGFEIGEGFAGTAAHAAHVNTMLGSRSGPLGTAWATALATPSAGHAPFMAVIEPGIPVQPPTLIVNKATIAGNRHARLTWGGAQAGVAAGVAEHVARHGNASAATLALRGGDVPLDELVLICAIWVDPAAIDANDVFVNNTTATIAALAMGSGIAPPEAPSTSRPWNPFFPLPS